MRGSQAMPGSTPGISAPSPLYPAALLPPDRPARAVWSLPPPWRERAEQAERAARARIVADYIAGMTDRYAFEEHRRLFDPRERV